MPDVSEGGYTTNYVGQAITRLPTKSRHRRKSGIHTTRSAPAVDLSQSWLAIVNHHSIWQSIADRPDSFELSTRAHAALRVQVRVTPAGDKGWAWVVIGKSQQGLAPTRDNARGQVIVAAWRGQKDVVQVLRHHGLLKN